MRCEHGNRRCENRALHRQRGEQRDLEPERQHQREGAECPDARVFHDVQRALAILRTTEAVGHIGQPVFVEGTGQQHGGDGAQQRCHRRRPDRQCAEEYRRTDGSDQPSHDW